MALHVDPVRARARMANSPRAVLQRECDELERQVHEVDLKLDELYRRRREMIRGIRERKRKLWPRLTRRGRCPLPDGRPALPPVASDAVGLWGRRLRAVCRQVLETARHPVPLGDLHALLHRRGYFVDSEHPVKSLADAMRYEVGAGRLQRVRRGTYATASIRVTAATAG
jgi:hypothetical protein